VHKALKTKTSIDFRLQGHAFESANVVNLCQSKENGDLLGSSVLLWAKHLLVIFVKMRQYAILYY